MPASYRLYLDTHYDVLPWPFPHDWRPLDELPAALPGATANFAIFLPEDHDDLQGDHLPPALGCAPTEMAIYRQEDTLIVVCRMLDRLPLPERLAPATTDVLTLWLAASRQPEAALMVQVTVEGELTCRYPTTPWQAQPAPPPPAGCEVETRRMPEGWIAAARIPLAAIPVLPPVAGEVYFTAGRVWGETGEPGGWATAAVWAPRWDRLGTLHLVSQPCARESRLHRVEFHYDAEAEQGTLSWTLAGPPAVVRVAFNKAEATRGPGEPQHLDVIPQDGENYATLAVGAQPPVVLPLEKWSGHRLFPRDTGASPIPDRAALCARFADWHARQEARYVAPGTWDDARRFGTEHPAFSCAFPLEAYALAVRYLEPREVYRQRMQEAADRLLGLQLDYGTFRPPAALAPRLSQPAFRLWHGIAGYALLLSYRELGDTRYLEASRRAADAYRWYSLEINTNFMAVPLWHLSELYALTGEERDLQTALWLTHHGILRGLTPAGGYPGHNYYTHYLHFVVKGLAMLLRVLPPGHPAALEIREPLLRCTNQLLSRQQVNGLFDARSRNVFGHQETVPALFEVARTVPAEQRLQLEPVLVHMTLPTPAGDPPPPSGLMAALLGRYLAETGVSG